MLCKPSPVQKCKTCSLRPLLLPYQVQRLPRYGQIRQTGNDSQTACLPLSVSETPRVCPSDRYSVPSVPRRCQIASRPRNLRLLSPSDTSRLTTPPFALSSCCPQAETRVRFASRPCSLTDRTTLRAPSLGPRGPPAVASLRVYTSSELVLVSR